MASHEIHENLELDGIIFLSFVCNKLPPHQVQKLLGVWVQVAAGYSISTVQKESVLLKHQQTFSCDHVYKEIIRPFHDYRIN